MAGGQKTTTTTAGSQGPWEPTQGYLTANLARAENLYNSQAGLAPYYPGQTVTGFSQDTYNAMDMQRKAAQQAVPGLNEAFNRTTGMAAALEPEARGDLSGNMTGGAYLNHAMDAMRPIAMGDFRNDTTFGQTLGRAQEDAADAVNNAMSAAGRYGSGIHQGALGREITDATNRAMLDRQSWATNALRGYSGDVMARQQSAAQQLRGFNSDIPSAYQSTLMPSQTIQAIGAQHEALTANQLEAMKNDWYAQRDAPWQLLERYNAMVGGAGSLGGTSNQTTVQRSPNNFGQQALGFGATAIGTGLRGVK